MATNNTVVVQEKVNYPVVVEKEKTVVVQNDVIHIVEVGDSYFSEELNKKIQLNIEQMEELAESSLTLDNVLSLTNETPYVPTQPYNPATKEYVDSRPSVAGYTHIQNSPQSTWLVEHGLDRKPSVTIIDSGLSVVYGNVTYIDNNSLTIVFNASFGGKAYLI